MNGPDDWPRILRDAMLGFAVAFVVIVIFIAATATT